STTPPGRDVSYSDDDDRPAAEGRVDIINDDRNLENFIGDCNIQAEPGDVNLNGAARIAQWNFTLSDLDEPIDLVFDAAAMTGETVEIGVPQVVDSRGQVVAPLKIGHVDELTTPDPQKSYGIFRLGDGDYTVVVPSSNDTDGLIELASSMPGLLSSTERTVTAAALQQTAAGVLQTQLGIRGVMPEVFNDRMGIDLGIDQYDACLDSDHNGFLTAFDLMTIDTNVGADEPGVYFLEDRFTPANLLEVNPLGQDELSIAELFGFSLYQNPAQPLDVNADGNVSPIDALTVINSLNSEGTRSVLVLGDSSGDMGDYLNSHQYLYDTNGDFAITPIDVLSVINHLNGSAGGEGEAVSFAADDFFLGYGQAELLAAAVDAPVVAAITSTGVDVENTYSQEQYTTPLQANDAWSESVDRVLSDMTDGSDADDTVESLLD
nr:dockerin type I domain-containing protein [Pirellulaceae bacterium]